MICCGSAIKGNDGAKNSKINVCTIRFGLKAIKSCSDLFKSCSEWSKSCLKAVVNVVHTVNIELFGSS